MRALAKRSEHIWLVTAESDNPPINAQVLDLAIGRLFPPHPYAQVLKNGEWEKVPFGGKNVNVEEMLIGVEVMPSQQDALNGFNIST